MSLDGNPYRIDPRGEGYLEASASMAIAFEQRTANLIALLDVYERAGLTGKHRVVWNQVHRRLGIPLSDEEA